MRLLMLLTVLVFCTSLANGMWKGKKYGVYKYKKFYLPKNCHAVCSEENAKDVKLVHKNLWKSQRLICSQSGGDKMGFEIMRDKEVCICFQDSDSSWVKRCGNCYVPVKINYKPEGYEPAIYSETESNSRSAAALEDESTINAIAEDIDLNPTPIQESEASNAPSGEVSNDDLEIPNKTNEAIIKVPKKKAATKKPSIKPSKKKTATKKPSKKPSKKKAATKKPSIKAHNKRKAKKKFSQSKNKRRFRNRKTEDISNDLPNRPDVGVTQDSWNDIPNNFQVEDESVDNEDLFAADELLDLYATE